jgi:sulfite reductase (NADPH) flavoprotein alpha-component
LKISMAHKVPVLPENAPFSAEQRLWLNGFLAGLFAAAETNISSGAGDARPAKAAVPLLILFGSQTGTAQGLARRIAKEAKALGHNARAVDAAEHATIDWKKEANLFVVTSTYGDGDMPDNIQGFWAWAQTEAASALAHLNFSVLALGDKNYAEFCAAGRRLDERLAQLGAKRLLARQDCDVDYETPANDWTRTALAALSPEAKPSTAATEAAPVPVAVVSTYSKANPSPARLLSNRRLNQDDSGKETRHFEFALELDGATYEAGDAFGVYPANCPRLVNDLLRALDCDGEEAVPAPAGGEVPLRKALQDCYDITKPTPELLERFGQEAVELRALLAPERKDDLRKWLWGREIIDLFLTAPATRFTAAEFVTLLRKLAPRLYSISSSPKAHTGQVHLTVNVVRYDSHGRGRKGVCSTFLPDRAGTHVAAFLQPAHSFRLPSSGDTPIIMVGPGTGVAPFRAFLHERRATGAKGRNWLFFGEQRATTDFYYRDELASMTADGHLTRLSTAFSRDQAEKIYVQHRMLEEAAELWSWLEAGAHFYVCGDATRMAKDVDATLHSVIASAGGLSPEAAAEYVGKMKAAKRYLRDVY